MQRFIYIHGTPDESQLGEPLSHGCIRMSNDDVIELFDLVSAGTIVLINAE
jgi:lipoprotein-anchoring transpeptidase ErfK/SrfK